MKIIGILFDQLQNVFRITGILFKMLIVD